MDRKETTTSAPPKSIRPFAFAVVIWVLLVGMSFVLNWQEEGRDLVDRATVEARSNFNKDLVYRRWATMHGGVYVPPTENTPPNPYLADLPHRDVVTTDGVQLTLINPAYMTRQVHEMEESQYGVRGHITSLEPLRPENRPDEWEAKALASFGTGVKEISSIEDMDGQPFMRFMRPMITETGCLKCHEKQGYNVGDIRGGISVSVPLAPYLKIARDHRMLFGTSHLAICLLGLIGIWYWHRSVFRSQSALESKQFHLSRAQEIGHIGTWELDILNNKLFWTDENCRIFQVPLGSTVNYEIFINKVHPEDRDFVNQEWQASTHGKPYDIEHRILVDGETRWVREKADLTFDEQGKAISAIGFTQDITDQIKSEEEKKALESQLQQTQKIESIGHLAGGVAHDFNNMLGVILGHTELALMKADPDNPFAKDLEQIQTAAKRSAELTRQMLTFARKQTISPKVLNLNDSVASMLQMLQRLIGENIQLSWNPESNLWPVKVDPSQLDQILANLCVNARDAINGIGEIVIETQNCSISEIDQKTHPALQLGDYVRLSVSDNGQGIAKENLNQIFEPFFTTKDVGQGTGLGLSTVYGAVKQNHGFIYAVSEPGQGATFHIYLPRQQPDVESDEETAPPQPLGQGEGTVLVVEDDQMLLDLTKTMLEESGYTVLDALNINTAISFAKEHSGPIDLLLSDLIMPEMNGKDLRDILQVIRPEMKVIFMSGYTDDIIAKQGVIDEGVHFLQKPVSFDVLTAKVSEVLDAAS